MLAPGFQFIGPCLSEPVFSQNPAMDASPPPSREIGSLHHRHPLGRQLGSSHELAPWGFTLWVPHVSRSPLRQHLAATQHEASRRRAGSGARQTTDRGQSAKACLIGRFKFAGGLLAPWSSPSWGSRILCRDQVSCPKGFPQPGIIWCGGFAALVGSWACWWARGSGIGR